MTITTEFILTSSLIVVTHEPTSASPGRTGAGVLVTEADVTPDTLTTIGVQFQKELRQVYVLWRPPSWHPSLSILYVQETKVLFVGGGTFSAAIEIESMKLVRQSQVCLFWSFQHMPNSILELGEIECFLYRTNGDLVGSVPVDPPYEVIDHGSEVEFVTSLFGRPRISYPSS